IAKRALPRGHCIEQPIGGFDLRGEAARLDEAEDAVPIGILKGALLRDSVEPGQVLRWSDVDIPDSLAKDIARRRQVGRRRLAGPACGREGRSTGSAAVAPAPGAATPAADPPEEPAEVRRIPKA